MLVLKFENLSVTVLFYLNDSCLWDADDNCSESLSFLCEAQPINESAQISCNRNVPQNTRCHAQHSVFTEVNMDAEHVSKSASILKMCNQNLFFPPSDIFVYICCLHVILSLSAYSGAELDFWNGSDNLRVERNIFHEVIANHKLKNTIFLTKIII